MKAEPILYFVGAGSGQNSWAPVMDALRAWAYPDLRTEQAANGVMAERIYTLRLACRVATSEPDAALRDELQKGLTLMKAELQKVKTDIARRLSRTRIDLRPTFQQLMMQDTFQQGQPIRVVTTNWDRTVDAFRVADEVHYLHGNVDSPSRMYLPAEVAYEEYRESEDREHLQRLHQTIAALVARWACTIKVYGLSFSPLDAELCAAFHAGLLHADHRVKEIHVFDPDYVTVAERIAQLGPAGSAELPIICHDANDPNRVAWVFNPDEVVSEADKVRRETARKLLGV